jgi:hypothetical protein
LAQPRPPKAFAQWVGRIVLRETFLTFAMWTAGIAVVLWLLTLLFSLIGR